MTRATINRRLAGVPFIAGPKQAKLYDREIAATAIESRDGDMAKLVRERAQKASIERELRQLELDERRQRMVPVELMANVLADLAAAIRSQIESWPITEAHKQRCFLSMESASIEASKAAGNDTRAQEQDLTRRRKQLEADIAAGRIPDQWLDRLRPQNHCRVWDEKLGRYMTKSEIIMRFGSHAQISPIDEILDEVAQEESEQ